MRIVRLFPFACAAFMMSACASENDDKGGDTNAEGKAQYMAVNIVSVGTNGSRAAVYEDGLPKESQIKDVRFYFYNQDGSPYILDGPNTNWTKPQESISSDQNTNDENITQETKSVLVFKSATGNSAPYSVIAVVNAGSLGNKLTNPLGDGTQELNSLLTKIEDNQFYKVNISAGTTTPTTNYDKAALAENFVMTSSVYLKDGEPQCQTLVSGHVYDKEDKAKNDPIDIYVERVVAKVTAEVNTTGSKWKMGDATTNNWETTKYGKVVGKTTDGKDVYAVLDGWNVADENGTAMLEKNIDKTWTNTGLGFTNSDPWYSADYHRCFWENSTVAGTAENQSINYSYTTIANNAFGADKYVYTLPNTLKSITTEKYKNKLTKFIVAAHLRHYNDGKGVWENVEICNYKGIQYIGQDAVLDVIGSESGYYVEESAGKYKSIGHEQLEFKKATTTDAKDYKAMAKVKKGVNASDVYYKDKPTGTYKPLTSLDEVNTNIQAETADVRADGRTYYFIPISHLGSDPSIAQYGIVRNHVYKITVDDMQGFGTPVVDKDAVIIPTKPENEATYLAAKIKVLSWRVVKQNADLDYSK